MQPVPIPPFLLLCSKPPLLTPPETPTSTLKCVQGVGDGRAVSPLLNGTLKESKAPPATSQLSANLNWIPALPLPRCVTMHPLQTLRALQVSQLWNGLGESPASCGHWEVVQQEVQVRYVVLGEQDMQNYILKSPQELNKSRRHLPRGPAFHKAHVTPRKALTAFLEFWEFTRYSLSSRKV